MEQGLAILRRTQAHAVVFDPWRPSKAGAEALEALRRAEGPVLAIGLALTPEGERGLIQPLSDGVEGGEGLAPGLQDALAAAGTRFWWERCPKTPSSLSHRFTPAGCQRSPFPLIKSWCQLPRPR